MRFEWKGRGRSVYEEGGGITLLLRGVLRVSGASLSLLFLKWQIGRPQRYTAAAQLKDRANDVVPNLLSWVLLLGTTSLFCPSLTR